MSPETRGEPKNKSDSAGCALRYPPPVCFCLSLAHTHKRTEIMLLEKGAPVEGAAGGGWSPQFHPQNTVSEPVLHIHLSPSAASLASYACMHLVSSFLHSYCDSQSSSALFSRPPPSRRRLCHFSRASNTRALSGRRRRRTRDSSLFAAALLASRTLRSLSTRHSRPHPRTAFVVLR